MPPTKHHIFVDEPGPRWPVPWLTQVRITDYKSIAACDVSVGPLTILVGPNGTGKSNFLDALAFVAEAVSTTPYQAIDARGGLAEILRRLPEPAESFSVTLEMTVPWGPDPKQWAHGTYGFEIRPSRRRGQRPLEVAWEDCQLRWQDKTEWFHVEDGYVDESSHPVRDQKIEPDRLYLPAASARPNFAPVFGLIRGMHFYNLDPAVLRQPQPESEGAILGKSGEHLGDVLGELASGHPTVKERVDDYLRAVAPGVRGVDRSYAGSFVTVEMRQRTDDKEVVFGPSAMSEGTVRAVGVLAALFQTWALEGPVSLVGIEEPEIALHPAAAGVLFDALTEASEWIQVLATSQSADLLDRDGVDMSAIRAVTSENGLTVIGEIDAVSQQIIRERRFTVGELMRGNQLSPETGTGPVAA